MGSEAETFDPIPDDEAPIASTGAAIRIQSEYAKAALSTWFALLADGKLKSATLIDFQRRSGLKR